MLWLLQWVGGCWRCVADDCIHTAIHGVQHNAMYGRQHRQETIRLYEPSGASKQNNLSGDCSKHCRSVAHWPDRNQSYDPEIVRSGVTVAQGATDRQCLLRSPGGILRLVFGDWSYALSRDHQRLEKIDGKISRR